MEHATQSFTAISQRILAIAGAAFLLVPIAGCLQTGSNATVSSLNAVSAYMDPATVEKPVVTVASSQYLGKADYICSPSGFGRTSTCFERSARR